MQFFKSSFRYLWKYRFISFLNVAGLTVGFICITLISLWINHQLSYDQHFQDSGDIYRLTIEVNEPNGYHSHFARCWQSWSRKMPMYFSEIEQMALIAPLRRTAVKKNEVKFNAEQVFRCNTQALDIFDVEIVSGNPDVNMEEPNLVLISESLHQRFFNNQVLLDSIIQMAGAFDTEFQDYRIAGIFRNFPESTHMHPEILVSLPDPDQYEGWAYTYFKLSEGGDPGNVIERFSDFAQDHLEPEAIQTQTIHLQNIRDIHLYSNKDREIEINGNIKVVYLFFFIGTVVLIISLINYVNLNLLLNFRQANTLFLKKILGAGKLDLFLGMLVENAILIFFSCLAGFIFLMLLNHSGLNFDVNYQQLALTLFILFWLALSLTLLPQMLIQQGWWISGISLKNNAFNYSTFLKKGDNRFRKILVILQFISTIVLISSAYYIHLQEKYLYNNRMGFTDQKIMVIKDLNWKMREKYPELRNLLLNYSKIKEITASMEPPSGYVMDAMSIDMDGLPDNEELSIFVFPVEENYIDFYEIPLISGSDFSPYAHDNPQEEYILNESAMAHLGFDDPEELLGRNFKLNFYIDTLFEGGTIKGVVKDFNLSPLHEKIKPLVLFQKSIWYSTILIKVDSANLMETIQLVKGVWDELYPEYMFDFAFDDDLYYKAYRNEIIQSKLSKYLTLMALIIACLGLFGISTLIIQLRSKEIGIRKVHGASSLNIFTMLAWDFLQWIVIALVIATPISWYILFKWSENYPYKADLSWWLFLIAGVIALVFGLISISYYAIKAATRNPVEALRYE